MQQGKPVTCLVALATYNEIENLPALTGEIFVALPHVQLLVVDDNSPDGTGRWCQQRAANDDRVTCLLRPAKQGLGTAAVACMRYAIEHEFDLLLTMDADFSHHPRYLSKLISPLQQSGDVDVVIGSRYVQGGGVRHWPLYRRVMSRAINWYARSLLGISARDCSGAFRCYRVAKLKELDLDTIQSVGYSYPEEVLWRLKGVGARVTEVPIVFADREAGSTKINLGESIRALGLLLKLALQNRSSNRPDDGAVPTKSESRP